MHSIKIKFILAISLLVILISGSSAFLLIKEKENELTTDIYQNSRLFADLSSARVVEAYEKFLMNDAFVPFKREFVKIMGGNSDISDLQIANFEGSVLYHLNEEKDLRYGGADRSLKDNVLMARIKSPFLSVKLLNSDEIVYLNKDEDGNFTAIDENGRLIEDIALGARIENIVSPVMNKYGVIYNISYVGLDRKIVIMQERILLLAVFGILIGLMAGYYFASRISTPIVKLNEAVVTIAKGNFDKRVDVKSKDEVGKLAQSFNQMAADLQASTKALIYKERVAKELELAAKIQKELLPTSTPKVQGLDIAAGLVPAAEIGGDCFDFIYPNEDVLLSYIGDVTGHGVPSGLVVAVANAVVYSFAHEENIVDILVKANKILKEKTGPNMFLTMLLTKWDIKNQKFSYVVAGHDPVILYKAKEKKVYQLKEGGMALGMVADLSKLLKSEDVELEEGDMVVIYTDGIPEAWANDKENYGLGRLKRAVSEFSSLKSAEDIKNAILKDVKSFMGDYEQKDDITLMVFKRT